MELKDNIKQLTKCISQRRSSFFGYNNSEMLNDKIKNDISKENEFHIQKLQTEYKEWPEYYFSEKKRLLNFWRNAGFPKDKSYLSKEQQEYLDRGIDMNEYFKGYDKFITQTKEYTLKKQWYLEKYQYCIELLEEKLKETALE